MSKPRRGTKFKQGYVAALKTEETHRDLAPRLKRYKLTPLRHCLEDHLIDKHARIAIEGKPLRWEATTVYA